MGSSSLRVSDVVPFVSSLVEDVAVVVVVGAVEVPNDAEPAPVVIGRVVVAEAVVGLGAEVPGKFGCVVIVVEGSPLVPVSGSSVPLLQLASRSNKGKDARRRTDRSRPVRRGRRTWLKNAVWGRARDRSLT